MQNQVKLLIFEKTNNMKLTTYEWNGKKFTSQDRLNSLFVNGKISREQTDKSDNGFVYGHWYKFSTLDGREIATFYLDSSFGFGTQATGVELNSVFDV